ncbi:hypothetical protein [Halogeometricum luteum]|uniref:Putative peptidase inhibitor domain-containing protein n=1 Tax=Halogeometricum luteum TaxID=2950537 RepID=A0ABU2G0R2_9EURY|nr:hypothetical protein [Halogeometricum sp. S3BR5-2]MDS0294370.1 hypothetical protein [Halogeometricum sp. S3BR5-2]
MYLSHPVRRMREDPLEGETAALVVELDGAERSDFEAALDDVDGTVERELQLGSLLVSVPEPNVDALCETDGLTRVETAGTLGLAIDDGE